MSPHPSLFSLLAEIACFDGKILFIMLNPLAGDLLEAFNDSLFGEFRAHISGNNI